MNGKAWRDDAQLGRSAPVTGRSNVRVSSAFELTCITLISTPLRPGRAHSGVVESFSPSARDAAFVACSRKRSLWESVAKDKALRFSPSPASLR